MRRKIVLFGLQASDLKHLSYFPGSTEFDLFAALSFKQLESIFSVIAIDLVVIQLDDTLFNEQYTNLAKLAGDFQNLVVINRSSNKRDELKTFFKGQAVQIFDEIDLIDFWDYMIRLIAKWQATSSAVLRKKMALLIGSETQSASACSDILLRNNFQVVYSAFDEADDDLLERQYDLVIATAENPDGSAFSAIDPKNRGFNKNTPFLFISKFKSKLQSVVQVFNGTEDLSELEVCVKKLSLT